MSLFFGLLLLILIYEGLTGLYILGINDGDKSIDFHNKCDKIGPNITFVKTKNDYIFGGFTFKNWEHLLRDINIDKPNCGSASRDSRAFGFSINLKKNL